MSHREHICRYADSVGDGSGTIEANGNYSVTPLVLKVAPPLNQTYIIRRMIAYIEDTAKFNASDYGSMAALTNGIAINHHDGDDSVLHSIAVNTALKTNSSWVQFSCSADVLDWGNGNYFLVARWGFDQGSAPIVLDGADGEYLGIHLNDDFTGLISHRFTVQGCR